MISDKFCNWGAARAWRLSSFSHLSGPSRVMKFLYAPAPPPPTLWAPKPPSWSLVHKTIYAPMIYTALFIMFWMCAYPLLGQVGGGWALEILSFFGSQMTLAYRLDATSQFPKTSRYPGPNPLPLALQKIMHRTV
jgi:hypothetical protein